MATYDQYSYVDATWNVRVPGGLKFEPWRRIPVSDVQKEIIEPSQNHNCFTSVQHYLNAVTDRPKEEEKNPPPQKIAKEYQIHYCGLFFDFDAKPGEGESHQDAIGRAKRDVERLIGHLRTIFEDINPAHIQVWFTGSKGFHVLVRPEVFEIRPHTHLTYMIKNVAWSLAEELDLKTLDKSVYSISRQWRIPNSVHATTSLRKIELDCKNFDTLSPGDIMSQAKSPIIEPIYPAVEYEGIAPVREAAEWWVSWVEYFRTQQDMAKAFPKKRVERPSGEEDFPLCMKDLVSSGPKERGKQRNHVSMVMATYWKDMGFTYEQCIEQIDEWTCKHYGHREERDRREDRANGRSAARSVYSDDKYAFTCASIRSCGSNDDPVACNWQTCKWVPDPEDQEPESLPLVHLSEASLGKYHGSKIRVPVHVSGKAESPYIVPLKGKLVCPEDEDGRCSACPFNKCSQPNQVEGKTSEIEWQMNAGSRNILRMIDCADSVVRKAVKSECKFPTECVRSRVQYGEEGNIEAVRLIPMVDYSQAYAIDAADNDDEIVVSSQDHSVRDGYYIGHGLRTNKKYNLISYTYPHPKDQKAVHVFDEAKPNQNDIEHFRLNDKMKEHLRVFQATEGQSVAEKMDEIHKDLCYNVHHIGGIDHMAHAVDLCFHSIIGFRFRDNFIKRGWFELLVVGDSGMGKSTMVENLIEYYRVGEMVAGEEAKRSGLVWASIQINGKWTLVWGKIPQNDRRLLIIDEFGGMDPEEISKLTQMRSSGKAKGQGVSSEYETWARTRLIFLSNVRGNRDILSFNRGIEAVASVFPDPADFRRIDLAIALRKGEVPQAIVDRDYKAGEVPNVYTSNLCHNLILWAWSRDPSHVVFSDETEREVIKRSHDISDRYRSDLMLVENNDMRHKVARVACSVAARLFSTDDKYQKVIVKPEHVKFAADLFDRCYGRGNPRSTMNYDLYARAWQERNFQSKERVNSLEKYLSDFGPNRETVLTSLLNITDFRKGDLNDQLAMDKKEFDDFWRYLLTQGFVLRRGGIYRKTGVFNQLLNSFVYDLPTRNIDGDEPPF